MSTPMPCRRLAALLVPLLAAACAPTQEWVHPMAPLGQRDADMQGCRSEAAFHARQRGWFERDRAMWDAYRARSPGDRALANMRLQQAETLAMLDRSRYFEACMEQRGYRLRAVE
ncbi:MAG: hypothetical protein JNK67_17435 [Alphaproteobacteria bacterium]|nr:hypothetical protein [Alphaproteobacteria bacterium]